jgi:hypothetical protein
LSANRGGFKLVILKLFSGFSELLRIARVLTDISGGLWVYGIDKGKKTLKVSVFLLIFSWFKGGEREAGPTASRLIGGAMNV